VDVKTDGVLFIQLMDTKQNKLGVVKAVKN
jgi:hypothetical protein